MQLNSMQIYNPTSGEIKTEVAITNSGFAFQRDLTIRSKSTVTVWDERDNIKRNDIFAINDFFDDGKPLSGMIVGVKDTEKGFAKSLSLLYGADVHNIEMFTASNSFSGLHKTESNGSQYKVTINTNSSLTTSNNFLFFDTACRQAMRKKHCIESFDNYFECKIDESSNDKSYDIYEWDNRLTNLKIEFASDTFDKLTIYKTNTEGKPTSTKKVGYLNNGKFSTTPDSNIVYTSRYEVVSEENFTDKYIEGKLKDQQYNNKFEFDIPLDNKFKPFRFTDDLLGRKINVFLNNGSIISSFVSGYSFTSSDKLHIKLGLSKTRLTEILRKEGI